MKQIKFLTLAARIEMHWWFIKKARLAARRQIEYGAVFSSQKLVELNRKLSWHSAEVLKAQMEYERLDGTRAKLKYAENIRTQKICC